jgi:O-antigen ligase
MSDILKPKLEWLSWLIWPVIFLLWQQPLTHYSNVALLTLAITLLALLGLSTRVSWLVWAWWGLGAITFFWSLTPGSTFNATLWEILYVAAFAAGVASSRQFGNSFAGLGFWGFTAVLFISSLLQALALNASGLGLVFFSGSLHYVLGAQALMLVIPLFVLLLRNPGKWMLFIWIATIAAVFALLMSGARAVYLPFVVLLLWSTWRAWREGVKPVRILLVIAMLIVTVGAIDFAIPFHPVQSALVGKASPSLAVQGTQEGGSFSSRVQMWDQTLGMAFKYPVGTGTASFKDVLPAFQKYPTVIFANAHNYYIETVATGGWLRLIVLVGLLAFTFWRAWQSSLWPVALGAVGLWATFAFDVTGYFPSMMMFGFAGLGLLWGSTQSTSSPVPKWLRFEFAVGMALLVVMVGMVAWWYTPCDGNRCAVERHFYRSNEVISLLRETSDSNQRNAILDVAQRFNPKSVWVWQTRLFFTDSPAKKLEVLREMNGLFPLNHPDSYLEWAKTGVQVGNKAEAVRALQLGLERFPPNLQPTGVPLAKANWYTDWVSEAQKMLSDLQ